MLQIATVQLDVKLRGEGALNGTNIKAALLEQLPAMELSKANIIRVREEDSLGEAELVEGLAVEHEKYGKGIILERKNSRKFPLTVFFSSGKMMQFTYDAQFKLCPSNELKSAIHPNRMMNKDKLFLDVGTVGYINARGKGEIMVITVPTRSIDKYRVIPVITHPTDYKANYYTLPATDVLSMFKSEPTNKKNK